VRRKEGGPRDHVPAQGEISDKHVANPLHAFLNIPYDRDFSDLYLAYIAGITSFGLVPRATLEIPGGERRLDRIFTLIKGCRYSFHDMSRVELDLNRPPTPRFNMPFELGLTVAWEVLNPGHHTWFVLESRPRRLSKSLSDLNGTDAYVHNAKPSALMGELCNCLVRTEHQPTVVEMMRIYRGISRKVPGILARVGTRSLFSARVFAELVLAAQAFTGSLRDSHTAI
jgi:hypothetical protein